MSEQDLTNHLNRRKCPPSFISSTSNEGKSNSSPGVPLIDIFLNPERADELKQVQMETAPKMKKTHNQTKVKFKKTKSSCSFPGGAEEILPKHLPPSLALSDTLLPFQYFSRISTHAQVPLLNSQTIYKGAFCKESFTYIFCTSSLHRSYNISRSSSYIKSTIQYT